MNDRVALTVCAVAVGFLIQKLARGELSKPLPMSWHPSRFTPKPVIVTRPEPSSTTCQNEARYRTPAQRAAMAKIAMNDEDA